MPITLSKSVGRLLVSAFSTVLPVTPNCVRKLMITRSRSLISKVSLKKRPSERKTTELVHTSFKRKFNNCNCRDLINQCSLHWKPRIAAVEQPEELP
ncbi:hypothetical protein GBA52_004058 [Prunus armeniaca]|nr:hypothetical protein GBA52_004058 [Prunus armeniaca]